MRVQPYKVLVVDDDAMVCDQLSRSLTLPKFEVRTSNTPMGATNIARSFRPDVVILDMNMPAITGEKLFPLMSPRSKGDTGDRSLFYLYSSECEETLRRVMREQKFDGYFTKSTPLASIEKKLLVALSTK